MCSKEDLKELGLGMGPRKKLSSFISQENERQEAAKERRARETAERLEQERREAKEAVDAAVTAARLFGVKILKGVAGTGQTYVEYPQLLFQPQQLFAIGSPIGLFLTVRYVAQLVRYIRTLLLTLSVRDSALDSALGYLINNYKMTTYKNDQAFCPCPFVCSI